MSDKLDIFEEMTLPLIPLRGLVGFPAVQLNIEIVRPISLKAFTAAATLHDAKVLLVAQKDIACEDPKTDDLYKMGVVAEIKHVVKNPHGNLSVIFEGISRAKIGPVKEENGYLIASCIAKNEKQSYKLSSQLESLMLEANTMLRQLVEIHPGFEEEIRIAAEAIRSPGYFADFVASSALIDYKSKQTVLEAITSRARLEKLLVALGEELMILQCERDIQRTVREKIDKNQKDYFLREQIKALQSELGEFEDDDELKEYDEKISAAKMPQEIKDKLYKELTKLSKTPFGAAEGTVIRTYLDTCLEYPFGIKNNEEISVEKAKIILDTDHDGLTKATH